MTDENKRVDELEDDASIWEEKSSDEESADIVETDSVFDDDEEIEDEETEDEETEDEETEDEETEDEDNAGKKDNKKKMIIGVALVAAIAAGGTIMSSGGSSSNKEITPVAQKNTVKAESSDAKYEKMADTIDETAKADSIVNDLEIAAREIDKEQSSENEKVVKDTESVSKGADIAPHKEDFTPHKGWDKEVAINGALKQAVDKNANDIKKLDERLTRLESMIGSLSRSVDEVNINLKKLSKSNMMGIDKRRLTMIVREQVKDVLDARWKARLAAKKAKAKAKHQEKVLIGQKTSAEKPKNSHVIDDWRVLAWAPEEGTAVVMSVSGQVYLVKKGQRFEKGHFTPYKIGDGYVYTDKGVILH